jgi:DNA replication protein DnaC
LTIIEASWRWRSGSRPASSGTRPCVPTAAGLITTLGKALVENRLEERLKLLTQPKLLIIDEIGYIPIDRQGANLFFQLVSRLYEKGSILLTSNQSLGAWGDIFGDPVIASAILDRLLHHATTINIKGESYRLNEKRRAGLLLTPRPEPPAVSKGEPSSLADTERK